jgi:hypothetical protein
MHEYRDDQAEITLRLQISRQSYNAVEIGKFDPSLLAHPQLPPLPNGHRLTLRR